MARIEWARLAADDVEHVIAVMLARENPAARRIRPSQGDKGVDILVPQAGAGGVDIYQVKSFAVNLQDSHKRQIGNSYRRLRDHAQETGLTVANWYLALPLDPTPENSAWFDELTLGAGFHAEWRGLVYVDGLAGRYPDVIDYYLRDGKDRLEAAVRDLTRLLVIDRQLMRSEERKSTGALSPDEARTGLVALHNELNRYDPQYRYDFSVDTVRPEVPDQPALVGAAQLGNENVWVTFKVFARYAEATDHRPLPIQVRWTVASDSATAERIADWLRYGTPFEAPLGSADVTMELPGGLGGEFAGAAIRLGAAGGGRPYELRAEIVGPSGDVVASARLRMNPVTFGLERAGSRASGEEENGVFALELRFVTDTQLATMSLNSLDITGSRPAEVLSALQFLAAFRPPSTLRFAPLYGPSTHSGIPIPEEAVAPGETNTILRVIEALTVIQDHTAIQILVPDLTEMTRGEAGDLIRAARLLRGETITAQWDSMPVRVDAATVASGDPAVTVMFNQPFVVTIGDTVIDLGLQQVQLLAAKVEIVESAEPEADGLVAGQFHPLEGNRDARIRHISGDAL